VIVCVERRLITVDIEHLHRARKFLADGPKQASLNGRTKQAVGTQAQDVQTDFVRISNDLRRGQASQDGGHFGTYHGIDRRNRWSMCFARSVVISALRWLIPSSPNFLEHHASKNDRDVEQFVYIGASMAD
jgi:hypothetical protein